MGLRRTGFILKFKRLMIGDICYFCNKPLQMKNLIFTLFFSLFTSVSFSQWTVTNFNSGKDIGSIKFYGATDIWLACDTGVFKSVNNGASFSQNGLVYPAGNPYLLSFLNDVAPIGPATAIGAGGFYLGNDEMIIRTTNSGANWDTVEHVFNTFFAQFHCTDFPTATTGYVAGWEGRILRSSDGGLSFTPVYTAASISWFDCDFTSANNGVVVGEGGIVHTTNGTTFTQALNIGLGSLNTVSFHGSTGYAGGYSSVSNLFRSTDDGATWLPVNFPYDPIEAVHTISADTVVVVTLDMAYKTTNGGLFWEEFVLPALPPGTHNFKDINFRGNEGYIACSDGVLLRTVNGGGNAKPIATFTDSTALHCENLTYTFYNTSPVSYTFQWLYDGVPVSTSYNLNISLPDSGQHIIQLIASNGLVTDTVTVPIYVNAVDFIKPLSFASDTACPGSSAVITVFNSQPATQYRLRNGFNNVGTLQSGNGGTLTFNTLSLSQTTTLNMLHYGNNGCYIDSTVTPILITAFPDITIPVISGDTLICSGIENYHADIHNTQAGVLYLLKYNGVTIDSVAGNGGTVTLSTPVLYGNNSTKVVHIFAKKNASCNPNMRMYNLHIDTAWTNFEIANPAAFTGDTIILNNGSSGDGYQWTFPAQSNIQTSSLEDPKIVINTAGTYIIKLKTTNDEGCADSLTRTLSIAAPAASGTNTFCGNSPGLNPSAITLDSYLDGDRNLYLTGCYRGAVNVIYFVSKMDSSGILLWYRTVHHYSSEKSVGQGIAVDNSGNVYVAGYYEGSKITFDTIPFAGNGVRKGFVAKYDSNGSIQWVLKAAPSTVTLNGMWISDVKIDSFNNIYITGQHKNGVFTLPNGTIFNATGDSTSAFIMTLDTSGNQTSYTTFGVTAGGNTTHAGTIGNPRLCTLSAGDILVASCFSDSTNAMQTSFGPYSFTDSSNVIYTGVYNKATGWKNVKRAMAGNIQFMKKAIADPQRNIYLNGSVKRDAAFLSTPYLFDAALNGTYFDYSFVSRIDTSATTGWVNFTRLGKISDIILSSGNELVFTGMVRNKGSFANQNTIPSGLLTNGAEDIVIGKYDASGNIMYANNLGTAAYDAGQSINTDPCGNLFVSQTRNRANSNSWPLPNIAPPGTSYIVERYSKDSFCFQDLNCNGLFTDTLDNDAALVSVWVPDLSGLDSIPVRVGLKSFGNDTLFSAQIIIAVNGIPQLTYNWTDTLLKYGLVDSLEAGKLFLPTAGTYQITAYCVLPNSVPDQNNLNDTVHTTLEICTPLAGTYTIGAGGNFTTFSEAVRRLEICGIGGHIYFDVLPGTYNDRLWLKDLPSSVNDSIVFRSANQDSTSVILEWNGGPTYSNAIVELDNVNYITFQEITIRNPDFDNAMNMNIRTNNGCDHINILNCVIERMNPDTVSDGYLFTQGNSPDNYLHIRNSRFFQGGNAVTLSGPGSNAVIIHNKMINQTMGAISCQDVQNPVISDNYIETDYHKMNVYFGIAVTQNNNGFLIDRNHIVVHNGDAYCITVESTNSPANQGYITNNMSSITGSKQFSLGMFLGTSTYVNVYNNSFFIDGNSDQSAGIATFNFNTSTNINIKNNIFHMADSGIVLRWTKFLLDDINLANNCYYTNNPLFASNDTILGDLYFSSLAQWSTYSNQDSSSFIHVPQFTSSTDLHILNDSLLDNKGIPFSSVPNDFDGDVRSAISPDIGCDEFIGNPNMVNVWPGDANNDLVVDNYDIIPLGFYLNHTGNTRNIVSNLYTPQQGLKWGVSQFNGQDKVYADCDGNGTIQHADTVAVRQNYGLTHLFQNDGQKKFMYELITSLAGPDIYFVTTDSVFTPGEQVNIEVWTGTASQQVTGLSGIGFQMNINPLFIEPSTFTCDVSNSWMCGISNCITFSNADELTGNADGTIVKSDGVPVNGFGRIATIAFTVSNSAPLMDTQQLTLLNYFALDSLGDSIVFNVIIDSVEIGNPTAIQNPETDLISIYPNPVTEKLMVRTSDPLYDGLLKIMDFTGRIMIIQPLNAPAGIFSINVNSLAQGNYIIELMRDKLIYRKRFTRH